MVARVYRLMIGRRDARIELWPDGVFGRSHGMYRIRWPDDRMTGMCNLARAKASAVAFARPNGLGHGVAHWHVMEIAPAAPPVATRRPPHPKAPERRAPVLEALAASR